MSTLLRECIDHNMRILGEALTQAEASSVHVEYAGSGDSGDTFDISYNWTGTDKEGIADEITYRVTSNEAQSAFRTASFESALEDIFDQVIAESGHNGWENNEGGYGEFTVHANGSGHLDHNDYYLEVTNDYRYFGEEVPEETLTPSP
jgi:hypothetical protein